MATYHFWRRLLDENGKAVIGADVNVYLATTTTKANIYNGTEEALDNPMTTDNTGMFEFYVRDYSESNGYAATQKFKLSWSGVSQDGKSISGDLDRMDIYPTIFQVDETDDINNSFNKVASNDLAYDWDNHIVETYNDDVHDMLEIDYSDSVDMTPNKLVSNYLMNEMWASLASAQSPTVETTGAALITINVGLSGGASPVKWLPSAATTGEDIVYADIEHSLNIEHPVVVLFEASGAEYQPWKIESIDITPPYSTIRVFSVLNIETEVTVIG